MLGSMVQPKKVWYQILQKLYRKSRQQTVSKPAFPTLLKELYKEISVKKPNNTISGFKKSGLCPLDKERVPKSKIKPSSTLIPVKNSTPTQDENNVEFNITDTPRSNTAADNSINSSNSIVNTPPVRPVTPRKALRTNLAASTLQNAKKRKRVQREHGEVLTYEESLERLRMKNENKRSSRSRNKKRRKKQEITAMILILMKIFAMHAMKKTHQAMVRIQKMKRSLSGCNVVNVRDGIT